MQVLMNDALQDSLQENIIERADRLHRSIQKPMDSVKTLLEMAEQAATISAMLIRLASVKALDEAC